MQISIKGDYVGNFSSGYTCWRKPTTPTPAEKAEMMAKQLMTKANRLWNEFVVTGDEALAKAALEAVEKYEELQ
jgi:hypothetical protein